MKKMSYVGAIKAVLCGEPVEGEVRERLEALVTALEKRAAHKSEGPTKAQRERQALAERVCDAMEFGAVYGSAEIAALVPELEGATPQKITPLMKLLGDRVVVEKVKGKAVYSLAE